MSLLSQVQQTATRQGLNLFGLVDARRFDLCQPPEHRSASLQRGCGSIVVLGTAGRSYGSEFARRCGPLPAILDDAALDAVASKGCAAVAESLRERGLPCRAVDSRSSKLNFGRLGEAAGFGTVSPVTGMLLHPEYGPWMCVRSALLVPGHPFGAIADASISERFQPCCGCARPCVAACPTSVHDGRGNSDRARCAGHRHVGGCDTACHSRLACPVGSERREGDERPLHGHALGLRTVQRWFGFGVWRVVPRFLRGRPRV